LPDRNYNNLNLLVSLSDNVTPAVGGGALFFDFFGIGSGRGGGFGRGRGRRDSLSGRGDNGGGRGGLVRGSAERLGRGSLLSRGRSWGLSSPFLLLG
jgi:hypothetical protein